MAEQGYMTVAVKNPVGERLKEFRRKAAVDQDKDMTLTDVIALLLDIADQRKGVKVA